MRLLAMRKKLIDPHSNWRKSSPHHYHDDSYNASKDEEQDEDEDKDEDEEKDETVGDQSVLKYHISVAAKIAAGACGQKRRQKSCSFFIPDLTLNKSMINIPPPPMDVFGEAVCRITDRAKIQTT